MLGAKNDLPGNLNLSFNELMVYFALLKSMETQWLPERRMYWIPEDKGMFKAFNYGKYMSMYRFETILTSLRFSKSEDPNQQILDFIDATNKSFQNAVFAGDYLVVDESMVKSFHKDLKGKMKIIRKPRLIENKYKNLCD